MVLSARSWFASLFSHAVLFGLFSLSFGFKLPPADYTRVFFLGQLFRPSQVISPQDAVLKDNSKAGGIQMVFRNNPSRFPAGEKQGRAVYGEEILLKPAFYLPGPQEKEIFMVKNAPAIPGPPKKEQSFIFHPILPYSFPLYFKDRQVAHVELMFKITPEGSRREITVKRKISSGNLEVDLLAQRAIGRYLFIRQKSFSPNDWQTVKIDLSARGR
jgi:hypothetical protein